MLKKLLNSCLDAYRGSHKSLPDSWSNYISVTGTSGGVGTAAFKYIAPCDGYCVGQFARSVSSVVIRTNNEDWVNLVGTTNWASGFIPVRAGQEVRFGASDDATTVYVRFYPAVGNG